MKHCTHCGHLLGLGRFCTNCGAPVAVRDPLSDPIEAVRQAEPTEPPPAEDWQDSTAERPAPLSPSTLSPPPSAPPRLSPEPSPPRVPPVVVEPPPPPRFPLFADEVSEVAAAAAPAFSASPPAPVAVESSEVDPADDDEEWEDWEDEGRPRAVWVVAALAVLAVLVLGAWFLGQKIGGDDDPAEDPAASSEPGSGQESERVDHTGDASADAPKTAAPNVDVDGRPTSYDASNMLDGVPGTAWRTEGDASGMKIVFTFADPTRITEVGLINGYAKKARDGGKVLDWYEGTRRIQQVTWIFTGGQTVRQDLSDDRELQTIDVEPVEVTKVVLKIVATTEPGEGAASRDFTAISDVLLAED